MAVVAEHELVGQYGQMATLGKHSAVGAVPVFPERLKEVTTLSGLPQGRRQRPPKVRQLPLIGQKDVDHGFELKRRSLRFSLEPLLQRRTASRGDRIDG